MVHKHDTHLSHFRHQQYNHLNQNNNDWNYPILDGSEARSYKDYSNAERFSKLVFFFIIACPWGLTLNIPKVFSSLLPHNVQKHSCLGSLKEKSHVNKQEFKHRLSPAMHSYTIDRQKLLNSIFTDHVNARVENIFQTSSQWPQWWHSSYQNMALQYCNRK